jgi:uncharacterized protein DUF6847
MAEGVSLTDALAERDVLGARRAFIVEAASAASVRQDRYSRSEVRFVTELDVAELHRQADDVARRFRELDAQIQAKNWEAELVEET